GVDSDDESSRLSSQLSSDSLSRHDDPMSYSREQRARLLRDVRATRMKMRSTEEVLQLDCSLDDLSSSLRSQFDQLVRREKTHAATVYNIVINSLTSFFARNEGEGSVESRMADFLSSRFVSSSTKTRCALEDETRGMEEVMVEVTSMILLQMYCVLHSTEKEKIDKMEIVKKLRHVYIHNCASAQKAVLEEDVTDVFGTSLPLYIYDLFVELGVEDHMPVDLEEAVETARRDKSLSVSSTVSPANDSPPQVSSPKEEPEKVRNGHKPSLSSRLEAMLDEFLDEDEPSSERSNQSQAGRRKAALPSQNKTLKPSLSSGLDALLEELNEDEDPASERGMQSQSGKSQGIKRKAPPSTPNKDERRPRRRVFVPETPDEKNAEKEEGRRTRSQMKEDIKAVVKQTPMDKIKVRRSTRGGRLTEIIKTAENSPSLTGGVASSLRSRVKEGDRRASLRNGGIALFKDTKSTSREEFMSANREKGEKKSRVRVNLSAKLDTPSRGDEKEERRMKKKRNADGHIASLLLDSDAMSKYKKRMKETVAEGSKADDTEVFYGRMSNRVGLFDDRHEKEEAKVVYNRAGRVVYSPSCVFVAHTLLNVHNKTPLLPSKPSTSSAEFKLNRLVRPASKGNRLKLKKLKERLSLSSPRKEVKKESI
ncbi:hypothetical protein PMAYCL1PPCAC_23284, partial [Pristionchus mayeri]